MTNSAAIETDSIVRVECGVSQTYTHTDLEKIYSGDQVYLSMSDGATDNLVDLVSFMTASQALKLAESLMNMVSIILNKQTS